MKRSFILMLPVYMLALALVTIAGLAGSILILVPGLIYPGLFTKARNEIVKQFMARMGQLVMRQMMRRPSDSATQIR